jgi:hypothetical protein
MPATNRALLLEFQTICFEVSMDPKFQEKIAEIRAGLTPGRPEDNDLNFILMEFAMRDEVAPSSEEEDPAPES